MFWFKTTRKLNRPPEPAALAPFEPVKVDCATPAGTLRTLALAYVQGDANALLACVDESDSAWPRGRVQGWAAFVEACGRLRRACDVALGAGSGDSIIKHIFQSDPKEQGNAML